MSLSVAAGDGETQYYTKPAKDLQSDIRIVGREILGNLKDTDDTYKVFDQDTAQHHLVLKLTSDNESTIETKMEGGSTVMKDYVTVDDGFCVYAITSKDDQKIHVKVTKGDTDSAEIIYDLSKLVLEES